MRLLAGVPSVIYGLIGVLVLVPFVNDHLISTERKESVFYVIQLTGQSLLVATLLLTVMIVPIMIAIAVDALRSVPRSWTEGALALGREPDAGDVDDRPARRAAGAGRRRGARRWPARWARRSCSRWSRAA